MRVRYVSKCPTLFIQLIPSGFPEQAEFRRTLGESQVNECDLEYHESICLCIGKSLGNEKER